MEPQIRYAKTSDGVNIAYFTMGEGPPLVHLPPPFPHLQLEWEVPEMRSWCERLAASHQLVKFDPRGFGLSDRDAKVTELDDWGTDLDAIVDKLNLDEFALLAMTTAAPAAIAYATKHPDRVSSLVLVSGIIRWQDIQVQSQVASARALIDVDWELYSETIASSVFGWEGGQQARRLATLIRASTEPDRLKLFMAAAETWDVGDLLPQVTSPTLLLHQRDAPYPKVEVQRELAAAIPNARLSLQEGSSFFPFFGDMDPMLNAIQEFLGVGAKAESSEARGGFHTILFTDVEGSTALTERLGDAKARTLLREHERITRDATAAPR